MSAVLLRDVEGGGGRLFLRKRLAAAVAACRVTP